MTKKMQGMMRRPLRIDALEVISAVLSMGVVRAVLSSVVNNSAFYCEK
jgi:hypothetical protein